MSNFDNYLADFARPGNRFNLLPRLTASGKSSGLSAEDIIDRVRALGVHDRGGVCLHLAECPFASKTAVRGTTIPATIKG